jgi:outer membrane protein assembly factor BamB
MKSIFLGVHGEVVALDRATGQELWSTKLGGSDFVNLLLDQDRIIATTKERYSASMRPLVGSCGAMSCQEWVSA